ncbi:MAG: hypothetical protein ACJAV6_000198 [Candidatus Paceibacteria bacterium]|jgi:hypothetical protein
MEFAPKPTNKIEQKEEIKNLEGIDFVFSENPNIERIAIESVGGVDFSQLDEAEFVSLYRAEGQKVERDNLPEASKGSAGTWFTTERDVAEKYLQNEGYSLYEIDVPKQFYEGVKLSGVGNVIAEGECKLPINLAEQKYLHKENNEISKESFKNFLIKYKKESGEITPEKIGEAKEVYEKYLDTIFPESKLKDAVYHSTPNGNFEEFDFDKPKTDPFTKDGAYFATEPYAYKNKIVAKLDIKNPIIIDDVTDTINKFGELEKSNRYDSAIGKSTFAGKEDYREYVVFDPEQIHILGSQKDQDMLKKFVNSNNLENKKVNLELPSVSIIENPSELQKKMKGSMSSMDFNITSDDVEIGSFTLNVIGRSDKEGYGYFNTIKLDEEFRGKDYSKSTYLEVIKRLKEDNKKLSTEWTLTKGADSVWQWLVENSYAKIIKEGERNEENKGAGYSTYQYESII